jgi:hypothetical protein
MGNLDATIIMRLMSSTTRSGEVWRDLLWILSVGGNELTPAVSVLQNLRAAAGEPAQPGKCHADIKMELSLY